MVKNRRCNEMLKGECCKIESILSIDDRGQMVLPKEVRERADLHTGEKLALVSWEKQGKICCMVLVKADELASVVKGMLGPLLK